MLLKERNKLMGGSNAVRYVAAMRVSDAAETVTTSGSLNLYVPTITQWVLRSIPIISKRYLQFTSLLMYCTIYVVR